MTTIMMTTDNDNDNNDDNDIDAFLVGNKETHLNSCIYVVNILFDEMERIFLELV